MALSSLEWFTLVSVNPAEAQPLKKRRKESATSVENQTPTVNDILDLEATFTAGQCFRWRRLNAEGETFWAGVLGDVLVALRNSKCGKSIEFAVVLPQAVQVRHVGRKSSRQEGMSPLMYVIRVFLDSAVHGSAGYSGL